MSDNGSERTELMAAPSGPTPQLLNLQQGARYIGLSFWTLRDYVLQGLIPAVKLPALQAREGERQKQNLRRVLVDVQDLDAFIDAHKSVDAADVQSREPAKSGGNSRALSPVCAQTEGVRKGTGWR